MADPSTSPDLPTSASSLPQFMEPPGTPGGLLPNGKKTKGRVKIKMEYIGNKLRRYTTFSKRKTGIMKKAYELSTLTGTQVMLLVASETGHVYTFATKKLQPMISSDAGKALIQGCLNAPDEGAVLDLAPNRTEFTFDNGQITNPRKRKATESSPEQFQPNVASFLPTMVQNSLFTNFNEEEYNPDDSDDSDSEEASDMKEDKEDMKPEIIDDEKEKEKDISMTLQQTLKDALKAAANNRQAAKKRKMEQQQLQQQQVQQAQQQISNAFLAPFLLGAASNNSSSNSTIFQLPQGIVSLPNGNGEGGASANNLFMPKTGEDAAAMNSLLSFPFHINLQQLMESAAVQAGKPE